MTNNKNSKPHSLWHFFSFGTFIKTFQFQKIWLSDVVQSNDKYELILHYALLKRITDKINADLEKNKDLLEWFLREDRTKEMAEPGLLWAFCFGRELSNLWMWKEYGDNFSGVAVEFNYDKLISEIRHLNKENDLIQFDLFPVQYIDFENIPENVIDKAFKKIEKYRIDELNKNVNEFSKIFSHYKEKSFKMEKEYRLVAINKAKKAIDKKLDIKHDEILGNNIVNFLNQTIIRDNKIKHSADFRCHVNNDKIVTHIECPFNLKDVVQSVCFCDDHSKEEIEGILFLTLGENNISVKPFETGYNKR